MHPEVAFTACGTCRVIDQKPDAECCRQPRRYCAPFRAFVVGTFSNTRRFILCGRISGNLGVSWEPPTSVAQTRSQLQVSGFLGVSNVSELRNKFFGLADGLVLHKRDDTPSWQCTSKNASRRNIGKPRESLGFQVQAEKSKSPLNDRDPILQNISYVQRIERNGLVPDQSKTSEKHSYRATDATNGPAYPSKSKRSGSVSAMRTRKTRTGHANNNGKNIEEQGHRSERSTPQRNGDTVSSSLSRETSQAFEDRRSNSFGRAVLGPGTVREKRQVLKTFRLGLELPDSDELNDVLTSLCRQRRSAEAHEIMDALKFMPTSARLSLMHNVKTYTIMIDICGKSRQLAKAFSLFYGMQREGLRPNVITYNAMVAACSRNNEPDLAFEVFKEMQDAGLTPDKFTYGALIDSCAKCGKVDRAFEIAGVMERRRIQKDQTIYSALMDACGRARQVDRAFSVYEDMKRCGVWPNLITFSVLIDTCANAREPEKAFELFAEVKHWGFPHANVVVYTALIDACAKAGWQDQAQLVLEAMIRDNVQPNEITYGALIDGWSRAGRLDEAFASLREMIHQQRVAPNAVLLGGLAESVRRLREHSRVKELWEIMVQYNVRISRVFYPSLMVMAAQNGDVDIAIGIGFHAFTSGFLRRCDTKSDDPCCRALADAIIFVRSTINCCSDAETCRVRQARMKALYDSTIMSVAEMDSVNPADAFQRCISWGDIDQNRTTNSFKRRGDREGNSKAKQARDIGLRSLRDSRGSPGA